MNRRTWILTVVCLLAVAGTWSFWSHSHLKSAVSRAAAPTAALAAPIAATTNAAKSSTLTTNKLAYRLANTTNSLSRLESNPHAILLANAFIDTDKPLDLKIPAHLQAKGDAGVYIVQAHGPTDARFRQALASAGAQIVAYIPNNAYLVRLSGGTAALATNSLVQAVLPYEPYYKIQSSLLGLAVGEKELPPGTALNVGLYAAETTAADEALENLGFKIIGRDRSAFGAVVRVLAPADWTPLTQSPLVQFVERASRRQVANDLSRVTLGISSDTTSSPTNDYLGLHGKNVLVAVNDSGVDVTHPDFSLTGTAQAPGSVPPSRVSGLNPIDLVDTNGHGTFVAGIIAGNGSESYTLNTLPYSEPEGSVTNADFRGKAPLANLFSLNYGHSDYVLQTNAALIGALISNNSWDYGNGDDTYDLAAASYDAATRDALPYTTGSQPVLFVFAAGNDGGGDDDGTEGSADTILSPGTAKNVITVGALEQLRNITNIVTTITAGEGTNAPTTNQTAYWEAMTDSSGQVARYSARGNVGIGTEGTYGRFKPDLVAPGTFVVSTRSDQWQWYTNTYYNPTNVTETTYAGQVLDTNSFLYYVVDVPTTAVGVVISIYANSNSPSPFPTNLIIYAKQSDYPTPSSYDIETAKNSLSIPPDSGGSISGIQAIQNSGFYFAVTNSTNFSVNYDLSVQVFTTNDLGDLYQVLEGMNEQFAPYYRYETGTSMAAAQVSGLLALIQDYFTNRLAQTPSPALMKALLLNGCRSVGDYGIAVTNTINYQGWGQGNIQSTVPAGGLTSQFGTPGSSFFVDQSPTNALATGDSHTFIVTLDTTTYAEYLPLQATLVWTDPPGDPAAAIKLVNNLDLIITNLDTGDTINYGAVYFGNDISPDIGYNLPWNTNNPANLDTINNVENILIPALLGGKYSVTVVGRSVNVNAVTAQTNNVVQDYALVIAVGEGEVTNAFSVTDSGIVSNPTGGQNITMVTTTNAPLYNQIVGASSPLLGTNTVALGSDTIWGSNGVVTIGQTNQWHFYIVTNTGPGTDYTNAAFITFDAVTLSLPRMGVYADSVDNATRTEADIDLYVSQDPSITNLNPLAISNSLAGVSVGGGAGGASGDGGVSLTQGGTEFVFFTNSAPGQIYYIGVKSEDRMGSEYAFLPVFTDIPFSSLDQNGNQIVHGLLLPQQIPDGNNAHPGVTNIFALAVMPMTVQKVIVTNLDEHQNFGDLYGVLKFDSLNVVLNNHDGFGNTFGKAPIVYDDSRNGSAGTTNTDGPGSLVNFRGKSALGPWILGAMDNSLTQTGQVSRFDLLIQPHRNLAWPGVIVSVPPGGWFVDYVDVPAGYTNLTFYATNVTVPVAAPAIQMYEKLGNDPTLADYDQEATLTNGTPPGNLISVGPPLDFGRYFVGLYNPNTSLAQNVFIEAVLGVNSSVNDTYTYATNSTVLLDDAVTNSTIYVTATQEVASASVSLVVSYDRISDLTFTLVSPSGQRILLMENRGGAVTNLGYLSYITNFFGTAMPGTAAGNTNPIGPIETEGVLLINYDFYSLPDNMDVFYGGVPIFHSGLTAGAGTFTIPYGPGTATNLFIVMDGPGSGSVSNSSEWTYTPVVVQEEATYLTFTDDTNLATVPIKYASSFSALDLGTNYLFSDFEWATNGDYWGTNSIYDLFGGWQVPTNLVTVTTMETNGAFVLVTNTVWMTNNLVSVVTDVRTAAGGSNYLALGLGTITRTLPFTLGRKYQVAFSYRGPGISGWWRGEGNATDSSDPENNGNNGWLVGQFNYPAGVVGQAFQFEDNGNIYGFAGTNTYIQVPASATLNVGTNGGLTVEGWINPTNLLRPQPLVEWLAQVPTNIVDTNLTIVQGPVLDPATGHYYYLLTATNWNTSETWAEEIGGHLVTIDTANEENWVYDTFTSYGTLNRDLWTGLCYTNTSGKFGWASGATNLVYTNWLSAQPAVCGPGEYYVAILGPTNAYPGLWQLEDNVGLTCGNPPTNPIYGVVEVNEIQTNGVQFWVSGTNWTPGITNTLQGCLYANLVDTNFVSHEIFSAPGLLSTNVYQHVALTYDTNTGVAALYLNGTNVATTNLGVFVPKTDGSLLIGHDMSRYTNNFFGGEMDEMSVYSRALSLAEIYSIYQISVLTTNGTGNTNGLIGKFDPSIIPPLSLAKFQATLGSQVSTLYGDNSTWNLGGFTFTATSNSLPLQLTGLEPGALLDSMSITEPASGSLYYLPEQALESLNGSSALGGWTMQVWDNRLGAYLTNLSQIVSWKITFTLVSNAVISAALPPQTPVASTVSAGNMVYYSVTVPPWAHVATNILVSSDLPVSLFFNQTNPPTGSNPNDYELLTNLTSGAGSPSLVTNGVPPAFLPLLTNQTYYLGVYNPGTHAASVTLEVDYDITVLTNGLPFSSTLNTNDYDPVRYFSFDVTTNAYEAAFQLLKLSGNADLVLAKGAPLPNLTNAEYGSFNAGTAGENIFLLTNSSPVGLSSGRWYLGVFKRDSGLIDYSVLAKELDTTNGSYTNGYAIINLTNAVPYRGTAGPGVALTNFFHFHATNFVANGVTNPIHGLRFELYNMSGNGDLTLQTNVPPLAPPFLQTSQNPGNNPELIYVYTNDVQTNLAGDYYLGVPNLETSNINFSVLAVILTNGYFPAFPDAAGGGGGAAGAGGGAVGAGHAGQTNSTVYHVTTNADSGMGSLRTAVSAPNRTVVFDISGTINLLSPLVITNSNLTLAGQTSPGGVTVAGNQTTVTNAHDVIVRSLRFRRGEADDSFQFYSVSNVIADHISAEWTSDNLVSVLNSSNVTVQWSIMADSLYVTNNTGSNGPAAAGSLSRYGGGAHSFYHNLYADNYSSSPRLGDNITMDFVNNVIYNWGIRSGLTGGTNDLLGASTNGCTNQLNYVGNYLIAGPDTTFFAATNYNITNIAFFGGNTNALAANWIFQTNNLIDCDTNGVLNGSPTGWGMFTNDYTPFGQAFAVPVVPVDEAYQAYERVLAFAGVSLGLRDGVDTNIVDKVRYQSGGMISSAPLQVPNIIAWWKGENNFLDSVGGNNGTAINGLGFAAGEVGTALNFNGSNQYMLVKPTNSVLNLGLYGGFTVEGWIKPANLTQRMPIFEYERVQPATSGSGDVGALFYINQPPGSGDILVDGLDSTGGTPSLFSSNNLIKAGIWQHIAISYAKASGLFAAYVNGKIVEQTNIGSVTARTSYTNLLIGARTYMGSVASPSDRFAGEIDELTFYNSALSSNKIAAIYQAGSNGKFAASTAVSAQPYLDTDQDGLPDFWEATFTTNLLYITSNNNDRDGDGYTDLEEYDNWLAGLHAVTTVTNPVAVDLYQLCGNSGHLAFFVSNSVHGSVYLTNVIGSVTNTSTSWSNTIAVFTPTNDVSAATNYTGYASFTFYATNLDTSAYFGPNTVSVIVSAVPILTNRPINIITLTNGVPYDSCEDYGSDYYHFVIPTNAYGVIFELQANSGPMALAVAYGQLPSVSSYNYFTNVDTADGNLEIVVLTNSMPVPLQTGDWYMAAINENPAGEVCYGAKITYLQNIVPPELFYPTNTTVTNILETVPMTISCVATDLDSPTLPLYYAIASGPAGMTMTNNVIYWTPTEAQGPSTNPVAVSVSNGAFTVTNTFAIIVLESNLPPVLPVLPPVIVAIIPDLLVVTNTATDPDIPSNTLSYMLTSTITSTNLPVIDPNGVISWTPTDDDAGSNYVFTTVVTDYNPWAVNTQSFSVTNSFVVFVPPLLPPEVPETNIVQPNSINWFAVKVPVNAIASSNMLLFATLPVNLWFSTNKPPAITNAADTELLANVESGISVLTTNRSTAPTNIVPGKVYFLGVQNLNSVAVTNAVVVKFRYAEPPKFSFFSIVQTNLAGTNGFLLTWYAATNYQFHLQWTRSLAPAVWNNFNGVISYTSFVTATNSQFQYFDDGSQAGDFSTNRFYRLLLLNSPSNTVPFFVNSPAWFTVNLGATFVYTNSARDWDIPAQSLSYSVTNTLAVTNLTIDPAGVITWTPALTAAGLTNFITTTVVDSGVPAGVFTNIFAVVVSTNTTPAFTFGSVTLVTNGMKFQWTAAANEQFQIRWTTNLAPANWTLFPDLITSATSSYSFVDTNTPSLMEKFYQLMLVP